jgi:hypothetical protein
MKAVSSAGGSKHLDPPLGQLIGKALDIAGCAQFVDSSYQLLAVRIAG